MMFSSFALSPTSVGFLVFGMMGRFEYEKFTNLINNIDS